LENNYVDDANGYFKVTYSPAKFRWALQTSAHMKEFHILIRNSKNKKIMAMCTADCKKFVVNGQTMKMLEGNFMCVHSKLRSKRLAQILLQENMRRQRKMGYQYQIYTSGSTMPTPFVTTHYMNRFLNPSKLCQIKYTNMPAMMSFKDFDKKHILPKKSTIKLTGELRAMEKRDL
jgi:glycylpeptide N-tetradecanoyltransferase